MLTRALSWRGNCAVKRLKEYVSQSIKHNVEECEGGGSGLELSGALNQMEKEDISTQCTLE